MPPRIKQPRLIINYPSPIILRSTFIVIDEVVIGNSFLGFPCREPDASIDSYLLLIINLQKAVGLIGVKRERALRLANGHLNSPRRIIVAGNNSPISV